MTRTRILMATVALGGINGFLWVPTYWCLIPSIVGGFLIGCAGAELAATVDR